MSGALKLGSLACAFAVLAGCTSAPPTPAPVQSASATADLGITASASLRPAVAAGPVPSSSGEGPVLPDAFPPSMVDGPGLAVSVTPTLAAPRALEAKDVRFEVYDVSAGDEPGIDEPIVSGTSGRDWQVPAGTLSDGRQYAWRARDANAPTQDWSGPYALNIDATRPGLAPRDALGGVTTHLVTGVPTLTWTSRAFPTVAARAFALLTYQSGQTATPGLPAGWRMSIPLSSRWTTFEPSLDTRDANPVSVYVADVTGRSLTFTLNDVGVYEQTWANGRRLDASTSGTLRRIGTTWQLIEVNGDITEFEGDKPVATYPSGLLAGRVEWSADGLPKKVIDPSERSISFAYGDTCAKAEGFVVAPMGLLCSITWWDGTSTQLHYVEAAGESRIGLIADAVGGPGPMSESGLGLGWDSAGRLASVRQPLANAAVAAGVIDRDAVDVLTQVAYDSSGRVWGVAQGAPSPGAERLVHLYEYPRISAEASLSGDSVTAAVVAGTTTGAFDSDARVQPLASAIGDGRYFEISVSAADWRPLTRRDRDAAVTTMGWDESGRRVASITDYEGRTTNYDYGEDGQSGFSGPSTVSDNAFEQTTEVDQQRDGTRFEGLAADYWASADGTGPLAGGGWIARGGRVEQDWEASPVGQGAWSGRFTGTWKTETGAAGDKAVPWALQVRVPDDAEAEVYIDNRPCRVDSSGVCRLDIRDGDHALRIDMRSSTGASSLRLGAEVDSGSGIPSKLAVMSNVAPNFGVSTATLTNDRINDRASFDTYTSYDEPWTALPTQVESPGERISRSTYEPVGSGGWGRKLTSTTPGGRTTKTDYWPVTGADEASPCPDAVAAPQAGQVRSITRTDGVVVERWFDAAGRTVAIRSGGKGNGELACWSFAADGGIVSSRLYGTDGSLVEEAIVTTGAGGDPRVSGTVVRTTAPGDIFMVEATTQTTVDLLGRLVTYRDLTGAVFEYGYDVQGNQVSRVTSVGGAEVVRATQEFDEVTGRPSRMSIDGAEVARVRYDEAGRVASVSYATGATQEFAYRANGTVESTAVTLGDGALVTEATSTNAAGRVDTRVTRVKAAGDLDTKRTWRYAYDSAARLSEADLDIEGDQSGVGGDKRRFDYGFGDPDSACRGDGDPGADLDRTSGSRDGQEFITCYDQAGRAASTTDPLMAPQGGRAELTWDALGRLTSSKAKGAELAVSWTWGGMPATVTDGLGAQSVASDLAHALGRLVAQRTSDDSMASTTLMAYANPTAIAPGLLLDGEGKALQVRLLLPGGALWKKSFSGGEIVIDHPGIRGELLVRSDSTGKIVPGAGGGALAESLGPFGEPLESGRATAGAAAADPPAYGYGFSRLEPTLAGGSGLVLSLARPYLPALGAYIAFDPVPGSSSTGYGFAEADPVNFTDPTGAYSWFDFARNVLAVASITASIMLPGSFAVVLAVSLISSAAQLSVTAWERGGYDELTTTDVVFEAISVGVDMAVWGSGAYKAWKEAAKATKAVTTSADELAESAVRASSQVANENPTLLKTVAQATLTVAGFQILLGGGEQPQQLAGPVEQQGGGAEPQECPVEGGCEGMPSRDDDHRAADRL
jgi:YD repeat-containing protein